METEERQRQKLAKTSKTELFANTLEWMMMQCYSFCCFFAARFSHTKLQLFDLRFEAYPKQVAFPGVSFFFSPFTSGSRLSYWWIVFVVTKKHLWQISPRFSFPSRNAHHPNDGGSLPNDGRGYGLHSLLYFWCDLPDPGLATEILEVLREKTSWSFFGSIGAETQLLDLGVWDKNGRCWGSETKKRYGESIIVMSCRRFVECQHIVLMEKDVGTASLPLQKTSSRLRAFLFWVQKNISWQLEAEKKHDWLSAGCVWTTWTFWSL